MKDACHALDVLIHHGKSVTRPLAFARNQHGVFA
jgi:hypothetical protein